MPPPKGSRLVFLPYNASGTDRKPSRVLQPVGLFPCKGTEHRKEDRRDWADREVAVPVVDLRGCGSWYMYTLGYWCDCAGIYALLEESLPPVSCRSC